MSSAAVWDYSATCRLNSRHLYRWQLVIPDFSASQTFQSRFRVGRSDSITSGSERLLQLFFTFFKYFTVECWNHDWHYYWSYLISPAADWISFSFWTAVCVQTIFNISEVMQKNIVSVKSKEIKSLLVTKTRFSTTFRWDVKRQHGRRRKRQ